MAFVERIDEVINKIDKLHPNDVQIYEFWDDLTEILSEDESSTIEFLINCSDKNTIHNISSVFADVSYKLQSKKFIKCIESVGMRFPELPITHMIEAAKNVIDDDDAEIVV